MNKPAILQVVIADDEPCMWDYYTLVLKDLFRSVEIMTFENGNDAWEQLQKHDPDLLIMDLNRPGLGGLETLRLLSERGAAYPILVVSGSLCAETETKARKIAGPNLRVSLLSKPCQVERLRRELLSLIDPGNPTRWTG
jgi:CheY-like chemotaxis protein